MSISLGPKVWIDYFFTFLDNCYDNNHLGGELSKCNQKSMDKIDLKSHKEYKTYQKCMAGYDKETGKILLDSQLGKAMSKNYHYQEKFLPVMPAVRINTQSISVIFPALP
jgi:hypothetical protein